jgi:selenocysteine lyase/cysteine desulfurase
LPERYTLGVISARNGDRTWVATQGANRLAYDLVRQEYRQMAHDAVAPREQTLAASPLAAAQEEFETEVVYLDTAAMGLPPRRALTALERALTRWRTGVTVATDFDAAVRQSRESYAALVGVDPSWVAVGSQVSVFVGLVASTLPDRSEVLTVPGEFTSVVFPFLAQAARGIRVREVPLEHLAEAVTAGTALVAVSAVQSADGRLVELVALEAACAATGTRVLLDTTQATGRLPVDASRFVYTTSAGYKWLLAPRGTAFFTVQQHLLDDLVPHTAGWYAGADPWTSIYGSPLRLAEDARRLDVSPAWHSWVGQAPALDLLTEVGPELHRHALGLANRFRELVGVPAGQSAIVSPHRDVPAPRREVSGPPR